MEVHRVPANKNYDTAVRPPGAGAPGPQGRECEEAIDDYEKWLDLYKRIIVDRSQH